MAICGGCGGQTQTAGELCPYCEYASATSPVGAYSGSAAPASRTAATGHGSLRPDHHLAVGYDGELRSAGPEQEFAGLPACERPFAADRTVWPDALELAPTPDEPVAGDDDLPADSEQPDPEHQPEGALGWPDDSAGSPADLLELSHTGRWIAPTVAILVLLAVGAGAATLVVQHSRVTETARAAKPTVTAAPSSSAFASIAPAGANQLSVDPAAAQSPDEAAVVAPLNRYFGAINSHDYLTYRRTFILALRSGLTPTAFRATFGTTTTSGEQLRSISVVGGEVDALVTFISQQPATARSSGAACTSWSMHFYLERRGGRYLLVQPPLWSSASSCP